MQLKGLQHALVIDDADSSINYNKSEIDSAFDQKVTLEELIQIFNETPEDIWKYNTEDCITIILKDGSEVPLNKRFKLDQKAFIKISNKQLKQTDNEILISVMSETHSIQYEKILDSYEEFNAQKAFSWQTNNDKFPFYSLNKHITDKVQTLTDFDGYQHTKDIVNITDNVAHMKKVLHAIYVCWHEQLNIGNSVYQGYLPSAGQMALVAQYADLINYIIDGISCCRDLPLNLEIGRYWTSTEYNERHAWYLYGKDIYKQIPKEGYSYVLPLFKKIN